MLYDYGNHSIKKTSAVIDKQVFFDYNKYSKIYNYYAKIINRSVKNG